VTRSDPAAGTPDGRVPLEGYAEEVAVAPGETIRFMLSAEAGDCRTDVVRLVHGDPSPSGPGYKVERLDWNAPERVAVEPRSIDFGSYVEIPDDPLLTPAQGLTLSLWVYPTRVAGGWQALASKGSGTDFSYGLYCGGNSFVAAAVSLDGERWAWCCAHEFLHQERWQFVSMTYEPNSGELAVYQWFREPPPGPYAFERPVRTSRRVGPGRLHRSASPLLLGASTAEGGVHVSHYNGKIGQPVLLSAALALDEIDTLARESAAAADGTLVGQWDLSRRINSTTVVDVSGNDLHGTAVNAPGRGVTGPAWREGTTGTYSDAPEEYNAIDLHEDDLADACWPPTVSVETPAHARSGVYALRVRTAGDDLHLPFVVRPRAAGADLALLLPTLTWQAYSSNRTPDRFTDDGVLDRSVCLYDTHSDGTIVYYCTRRKPSRYFDPRRGFEHWGAHTLTADLSLIDWLEAKDVEYDTYADQHLHSGALRLADYRCLLLGSHPEYWTWPMQEALREYLDAGGRLVYVGGNGLWWVTSLDPDQPHVMEVRKSAGGHYPATRPEAGQQQHSTTLEPGGLWSDRGHPPREVLGVEYRANYLFPSDSRTAFARLPSSRSPEHSFIFDGVDGELIGDFGLTFAGAAGFEMDATGEWVWEEERRPVVLARASDERFYTYDSLPAVSEVAFSEGPRGGAVFSAGSVAWSGSLSHNDYANSVSRMTENVLRRFLETPSGESVLAAARQPDAAAIEREAGAGG
jgi:N,N-dimethylformamidase